MHSGKKIYGAVSINMPAPYPFIITAFCMILLMLLLYGVSLDFTTTYVVKGYLNPKLGIAPVYASRPGIISRSFVVAGQTVAKGDDLFLVDTLADKGAVAAEQLLLDKRLLRLEHHLHAKTQYLHALKPLVAKHFVSVTTYQSLRDQLIALEANRYELKLASIHQRQSVSYRVKAPIQGVVSSVEAQVGQTVTLTQSLLTLVPQHAELVAQLYVPVAKSGFLHPGASIALRYDAYPYQQFGVATAHIQTIAQSISSDREDNKPLKIGEPYYKVMALLDRQFIHLSDKKLLLQQGMTCTAVLSGAHKKLWRWILDPLHGSR